MRILFVASSMGFGGAERVISVLSSELARRGHQVGIYMTKATKECVYPLNESVELFSEDKLGSMSGVIKSIRRFVKKYDPDIVVPFMTYQCIYTSFALAFSKYPVVVCERNDPNSIDGKNAGKLHFLMRDMAFGMAEGAVFQTEGARAYFSKKIQKKSKVILNPINDTALIALHDGERDRRIVTVGRLNRQKNQAMLITAFSKIMDEFPDYTLEIYGDGEEKEKLITLCSELGAQTRVKFMGNVKGVGEKIRSAAIFAFTSDHEGMPNALAEAMALGLACVTTDCSPGGARMLINDGENGIIVPCGDVERFTEELRGLILDPEKCKKLGHSAVSIRDRMDLAVVTSEWERYFEQIIKKS